MPSEISLATKVVNKWYCEECAIEADLQPGIIKETKNCEACNEIKVCSQSLDVSGVRRQTLGNISRMAESANRQLAEAMVGRCPSCHEMLDSIEYHTSGIYESGSVNMPSGDFNYGDADHDDATTDFNCPECGHEEDEWESFLVRADSISEETEDTVN